MEINIIKEFYISILKEDVEELVQGDKLQNLKSYCQMSEYVSTARMFLDIEYLYNAGVVNNEESKSEDTTLSKLKEFVTFHETLS